MGAFVSDECRFLKPVSKMEPLGAQAALIPGLFRFGIFMFNQAQAKPIAR
jgi:hypothetical protein